MTSDEKSYEESYERVYRNYSESYFDALNKIMLSYVKEKETDEEKAEREKQEKARKKRRILSVIYLVSSWALAGFAAGYLHFGNVMASMLGALISLIWLCKNDWVFDL